MTELAYADRTEADIEHSYATTTSQHTRNEFQLVSQAVPLGQFGPLEIIAKLGEGGLATVFAANNHLHGRPCALKVLKRHRPQRYQSRKKASKDYRDLVEQFHREARIVGRMDHPRIVRSERSGTLHYNREELHFIELELLRGLTLSDCLHEYKSLREDVVVELGIQMCQALQYLQEQRVVHRDIKPSNIMRTSKGWHLLDFSLAKSVDDTNGFQNAFSSPPSQIQGTPSYMAPEVAAGEDYVFSSELYCLGLCLRETLTNGDFLHQADDQEEILATIAEQKIDPLREDTELKKVINGMMNWYPEERYKVETVIRKLLSIQNELLKKKK